MDEIIEYYRSALTGHRLIFRSMEIESIAPTSMGADLRTGTGTTYRLTSHRPERTERYIRPLLLFEGHHHVFTLPGAR